MVTAAKTLFLRDSNPMAHRVEQAPLLRGCPDRGGERQAKGGAHSLRSNAWGEARKARFASHAR